MPEPRVWNMRDPARPKLESEGGTAVYVGRPTQWGNPYVIGADGTRQDVIHKYEALLTSQGGAELAEHAFQQLRGKDLVCWCYPAACHADVLLRIANPPEAPHA